MTDQHRATSEQPDQTISYVTPARITRPTPDLYRLVRFQAEGGAAHLKLQGYFSWTQGWSRHGGEWRDIETVDADNLSDDKPYGPLL
jgi:hypothetical protein